MSVDSAFRSLRISKCLSRRGILPKKPHAMGLLRGAQLRQRAPGSGVNLKHIGRFLGRPAHELLQLCSKLRGTLT